MSLLSQRLLSADALLLLASATVIGWTSFAALSVETSGTAKDRPAAPLRPAEPIDVGPATMGSHSAPVAMIEFADFQCPYCAKFARDLLPTIKREFLDKDLVLFSFRNAPLSEIHPQAEQAAKIVDCAAGQGRRWEMMDLIFADQLHLDVATMLRRAVRLGLDRQPFELCIQSPLSRSVVEDENTAKRLGIQGTPTFYLGRLAPTGRLVVTSTIAGTQSLDDFERAINALLAR